MLAGYEQRVKQLIQDQRHLGDAKSALNMDFLDTDRTVAIQMELNGLKEAWSSVRTVWKALHELKETQWSNVSYRKVRSSLEELVIELNRMPRSVHSSAAWVAVESALRKYKSSLETVKNLLSDTLKDRHWKQVRDRAYFGWRLRFTVCCALRSF